MGDPTTRGVRKQEMDKPSEPLSYNEPRLDNSKQNPFLGAWNNKSPSVRDGSSAVEVKGSKAHWRNNVY
jgi:hypothetical protein